MRESSRASDLFSCHRWTAGLFDTGHMKSVWHWNWRPLSGLSDDFLNQSPVRLKQRVDRRSPQMQRIINLPMKRHPGMLSSSTPKVIFHLSLSRSHAVSLILTEPHLSALWLVWQAEDILPQPIVIIHNIHTCRCEQSFKKLLLRFA